MELKQIVKARKIARYNYIIENPNQFDGWDEWAKVELQKQQSEDQ